MSSKRAEPPDRPFLRWLAGAAIVGGAYGLGVWLIQVTGLESIAFIALFVVGVGCLTFMDRLGVAGILAIVSGAFALAMYLRITEFENGKLLKLDVASAPQHPEASAFIFTDGKPRPEYLGIFKTGSQKNRKYYSAVPVVGASWTSADPVPVWAGCLSEGCEADFTLSLKGALVHSSGTGGYENAIAAVEQKHGLKSAVGARIVQLVADPLDEVQLFHVIRAVALAGGQVIWAGYVFTQTLASRRLLRWLRSL